MTIIKLTGGLGNQMFQYAFGQNVARQHSETLYFFFTTQKGAILREYKLDVFDLKENYNNNYWDKLARKLLGVKTITQMNVNYNPKYIHTRNAFFLGYWQSEKYFADIADIIRKDFVFKTRPDKINRGLMQRIRHCESVSLHVRRNDYATDKKTNKVHGVCDIDYYPKAIEYIGKKVRNPYYYIFSDDPEWCRKNLQLRYPTDYMTHNLGKKDYEDMRLMSACKHNIIANSSFSWWGAWLNRNPHKIVVAPKKWFKDSSINSQDIVPKTWIQL